MKKLLILGAGIYQVPLIKKAKELGLYTIVVSILGNYPGFEYADKVYYIDIRDKEKVLEIAQIECISGICTTGSDISVKTIGYVCDKMNLAGVSYKASEFVTDKTKMKEILVLNGVTTPKFYKVFTFQDLIQKSKLISFPIVVKPVDSSGSRGITIVKDNAGLEEAYVYARKVTKKEYIIVEEFIEGIEIGVDGFIEEELKFLCAHNKIVYNNGLTDVPIGHSVPLKFDNKVYNDIKNEVIKSTEALGLSKCAINLDVIIKNDKAYILEIGARCGATCIPELINTAYDIDVYENIINLALGKKIELEGKVLKEKNVEVRLLTSNKSGKIKDIIIHNEVHKNVVELVLDYNIGDNVRKFEVGPDRVGHIVIKNKCKNIDSILGMIMIKIENDAKEKLDE